MRNKVFGIALIATALLLFSCGDKGGHSHDFSGAWQHNATQHWKECPEDGEKSNVANHAPMNGVCSTCGYDSSHSHDFSGDWQHNATQHWKECPEDGEKSNVANHAPTNGVCSTCGYDNTPAHTSMEMVRINGRTFTMGSPATEPDRQTNETQHSVTLTQGFYMGKYQVTQGQYEEVMGALPTSLSDDTYGKGDAYPVYYVSWYDALVFCNKLSVMEGLTPAYSIDGETDPEEWGEAPTTSDATWNAVTIVAGSTGYRLPTEAQWEYACRAGTTTAFNWGTDKITTDQANFYGSSNLYNGSPAGVYLGRTAEVGSYEPNEWGLYDMHGNVYEWCWDWYGSYSDEAQTDPDGAASGADRVFRGGGWNNVGQYLRSACRSGNSPSGRYYAFGFRLMRP